MTTDIKLGREVITPEVFGVLDAGGHISVSPAENSEEDGPEPPHAALYDQDGQFLDWLF